MARAHRGDRAPPRSAQARRRGWRRRRGWIQRRGLSRGAVRGRERRRRLRRRHPRDYGDDDDTPQGGHPVARTATATPPLSVGGPRAAAAALHEWRSRVRRDETHFLEELIRRTFDPSKVDAVRGRPAWLERLLNSDRGRGVLFSLAERHPNCLLITIAIQHAWNHGHADEVRALGPAAASYFSIFHELLADLLRDLISAGDDEAARDEAARNIKSACCQSLATYLFAQMMLADLASGGDAGTARPEKAHAEARDDAWMQTRAQPQSQTRALAIRVSQELEEAAAKVHGAATTRKIAPLFASTDADATAMSAVGELLQSAEEQRQRRGLAAAVGSGSAASLPPGPARETPRRVFRRRRRRRERRARGRAWRPSAGAARRSPPWAAAEAAAVRVWVSTTTVIDPRRRRFVDRRFSARFSTRRFGGRPGRIRRARRRLETRAWI